jgi:hypothetical protein
VREGDKTHQLSAIEGVLRAQYAAALKGSTYAQKHILERYDRAEGGQRQQIAEEVEQLRGIVAWLRATRAEAERQGEPSPMPYPHPDDVVIDIDTGVRIVGPIDEEEARKVEETCKMRDVLLMQDALDQRMAVWREGDDPLDRPGTALVFAQQLNGSVPARYRLSEFEIVCSMLRRGATSKRELLKTVYRAWRCLGAPARRGTVFPPLRFAKEWIEMVSEVLD